jgi:glycosyltransferase involved in cell wall biosynthesis
VPYVLEPHGTLDDFLFGRHKWRKRLYEYLIERRNFRHAAALRFLSAAEASMARRNLRMSFKEIVIPSGIEPNEFKPTGSLSEVIARYGIPADRPLVAFVGRLHMKKGVDLLIEAFIQLARVDQSLHLAVIGPDDGMEGQVRAAVVREKMNSRVTITGMVTGQDKIDLMSAASVVAIPSYTENFCNVAIEAMALGVPLVISEGVGIAQQIREAGAGVIIAPTVEAIKTAIQRVVNDPKERACLGLAGRALASESFSWTAVGARTEAAYQELMLRHPRASRSIFL